MIPWFYSIQRHSIQLVRERNTYVDQIRWSEVQTEKGKICTVPQRFLVYVIGQDGFEIKASVINSCFCPADHKALPCLRFTFGDKIGWTIHRSKFTSIKSGKRKQPLLKQISVFYTIFFSGKRGFKKQNVKCYDLTVPPPHKERTGFNLTQKSVAL